MSSARPFHMPLELVDDEHCITAIRADRYPRGRAIAFFASEWGEPFTAVRVRKQWFCEDVEGNAERLDDGLAEPYDGWPLVECGRSDTSGAAFWVKQERES